MEGIHGIIFDLDGVLVFTDRFHYAAWKQMADELGVYFDEQINNRLRGVSRMESLDIILERYEGPALSSAQKLALAEKKNERYRALLTNLSPADVSAEARETLHALRRLGYRLAVGSSSKNAKYILERTQLTDCFDAISDGTNITKTKPDPEVFLKAAAYLQLPPESCAVVEDAFSGIEAANHAGMLSIGIGDAARCPDAAQSIAAIGELLRIFEPLDTVS